MVNHAVRADWCAHIALSDDKTGWTLRVPLVLTLLALAALLFLAVSTPQREGFLAAKLCHLEELGASEVVLVGQHHQIILIKRLIIGRSSLTLSLLSLLARALSISVGVLLTSPTLTSLTLSALATLLSTSVTTSTGRRGVAIVYWLMGCSWMSLSTMSRRLMGRLCTVRARVSRGSSMRSLVTSWHHIMSLRVTAMTGSRLSVLRLGRVSAGPSATTVLTMSTSAAWVGFVGVGVALRALTFVIRRG